MNNTIRHFDEMDWKQYNESERFQDGTEPFIFTTERNTVSIDLIGDARGIEIDIYGEEVYEEEEEDGFTWHEDIRTTPDKIQDVMKKVIRDFNLDGDWYAPDISYRLDHWYKAQK